MQTPTIDSPEREQQLRERLLEFTHKLHQALALAQDRERRAAAAGRNPRPGETNKGE